VFDDYVRHDGLGLAALIAKGDVTAKEVLEAAIFRAEQRNPEINAIVTPLYDYAHERVKQPLSGPFAGVPFLLKDAHHALRGTPMSNGSRLHLREVSSFDAEIVRRFLSAGVVVFGKTNTPEYKLSGHTICEAWGATRNPWDVTRSAAGSSGGSAAAVAAGIVPLASATDEGGSIRLPASACGIFGLKPTRGRNPIGPDFGWECAGQSTSHVVSRTVRDSAAMLDATAGPEPGSPYGAPSGGPFLAATEQDPAQLRVGISTASDAFGLPMDRACVDAIRRTGHLLQGLGHQVEEISLPYDEWEVFRTWIILGATDTAAVVAKLEAQYGAARVRSTLEAPVRLLAAMGRFAPAEVSASASHEKRVLGVAMAAFFEKYDVLVIPASGRIPVPLDEAVPTAAEQRVLELLASRAGAALLRLGRIREAVIQAQLERLAKQVMQRTMIANLTGIPAMSVPLHRTENDLPVGVQFLGRFGGEATLLKLAAQLERAKPWRVRR
jgi:amidase